jgi:hypothetical protein
MFRQCVPQKPGTVSKRAIVHYNFVTLAAGNLAPALGMAGAPCARPLHIPLAESPVLGAAGKFLASALSPQIVNRSSFITGLQLSIRSRAIASRFRALLVS